MSKRLVFGGLLALCVSEVDAATEDNFHVRNGRDLIELCDAKPSDGDHRLAVSFCYGFVSGAYHHHKSALAIPEYPRLACLPEKNPPSRVEFVRMLVDWARKHPEYQREPAIDMMFRFLDETWPCPESTKGGSTK
jgi:hypothetical protein